MFRLAVILGVSVTAMLSFGCSRIPTSSAGSDTSVGGKVREDAVGMCAEETMSVAEKAGYDYVKTVTGCLARDEGSIHDLFVMTAEAGFDAASSEGNSYVLGCVLRDTGDRFFGGCLALESRHTQEEVRSQILFDIGYGNTRITADEIRRMYPKTFPVHVPIPN